MTDPALFNRVVFDPYGPSFTGWYATNRSGQHQTLFGSDLRELGSVLSPWEVQDAVREYYTQEQKPRHAVTYALGAPARFLGGIAYPRWQVLERTTHGDVLEVAGDGNRYFDYQHAETWDEAQS